jgi:excinuclease ABC subunit A
MGPGGGADGGRIVATGTPEQIARAKASLTGRYLAGPAQPHRPEGERR